MGAEEAGTGTGTERERITHDVGIVVVVVVVDDAIVGYMDVDDIYADVDVNQPGGDVIASSPRVMEEEPTTAIITGDVVVVVVRVTRAELSSR